MQNTPFDWNQIARLVLTSRLIDRIEEEELAPQGKITYQFSSGGHELSQVLLGLLLDQGNDAAGVYYRSRPFMLASGLTIREAFAADMARTDSPSEGRDVGVVYSMRSRGRATVLPSSGDVGAQYTPAAGWAQAARYQSEVLRNESWRGAIAAALGGDGSVASNGFWAALTIATTQRLPMIFLIEDNGYGISVPSVFQTPGGDIAENLAGFGGLKRIMGSGTDPEEASQCLADAVIHARSGAGPALVRLQVPRLTGHTYGEDQTAYKSADQIAAERAQDPLQKLQAYLKDGVDWEALETEIEAEVRTALAEALAAPEPDPTQIEDHLFSVAVPGAAGLEKDHALDGPRINMSESIRRTLEHELEENPQLLVFGEDVGPRGGVHRVTLGLQSRFGEARVFDTSLSEEGIMGRAQGLALAGLLPSPEIQFRKYADPAYEQMHDIGWVRWRTAGKFSVPVVVRIPFGFSKRTGDPWHSVSDESVFAHMPGWRIAVPSNAADAAGLLRSALRGEDPVVFLEHRALYDTPPSRRPYPGDDYMVPFGKAAVVRTGNHLTVVSWGEMLHRCLEAAESFPERVEVIDLRTLSPWDRDAVLGSVRKTGKLLVAHEDTQTAGFAAEIMAVVMQEAFEDLDAPVERIVTPDIPIPYNIPAMQAVIPSIERLRAGMDALLRW